MNLIKTYWFEGLTPKIDNKASRFVNCLEPLAIDDWILRKSFCDYYLWEEIKNFKDLEISSNDIIIRKV